MYDPVFDADGVTLYHGDCLTIMPVLATTAQLVLVDLPYGTTRQQWDRRIDPKLLWHCWRGLTGDRDPVVMFATGLFMSDMIASNRDGFSYDLIWSKLAISGHLNAKRQPLRAHENIVVFYDKQPTYNPQMIETDRTSHSRGSRAERTTNQYGHHENTPVNAEQRGQYPRSIIEVKRPKTQKGRGHPSQKPVELLEWLIRTYTDPGDTVLDNAAGSSSTLVAARNCGRHAIGIEADDTYIDMSIDRLHSGAEGDKW